MSHFTVLVRVPAAVPFAEVSDKVAEILAPYDENLDPAPDFRDDTDEVTQEWENDTQARLRLADGTLESPYEEKYLIPRSNLFDSGNKYSYPAGAEIVHVPVKQLYESLAAYAASQGNIERDGRFGYMTNLRGHWDWFQIGGRWRGKIPHVASPRPIEVTGLGAPPLEVLTTVEKQYGFDTRKWEPETRAGFCDGVRLRYVDHAACQAALEKGFDEFHNEYVQFLEGKDDWPAFEGPRDKMLDFGLLRCLQYGEFYLPPDRDFSRVAPATIERWRAEHAADVAEVERLRALGWKVSVWGDNTHSPGRRCDVIAPPKSRGELLDLMGSVWSPLRTYAFVDAEGWRQPGKMGWFGCSLTTAESNVEYNKAQHAWITSGDQDDWIVVVDCHV